MPSFDVVSKTDISEVDNAINGAIREISNRYDFKNSQSHISRNEEIVEIIAEDQYKIEQVQQIFRTHLVKRRVSSGAFEFSKVEDSRGGLLKQTSKIIQGVDRDNAQKINKAIKERKMKIQINIRGDELRISGNKRDILQEAIQLIKDLDIKQPLQFINFRDWIMNEKKKIKKLLEATGNKFEDKLALLKYIGKKDSTRVSSAVSKILKKK